MEYKVVEKFVSINGEGYKAGQLAVFVRFAGCNLNCGYCDTKWANEAEAPYEIMTEKEILDYIKETGVINVTLTGGEPLCRKGCAELLAMLLSDERLYIEIETNGSIDLSEYKDIKKAAGKRLSYTCDYKLPMSGMEAYMKLSNMEILDEFDTVKFVSSSRKDLDKAKEIIDTYRLDERCHVYISPVFGAIKPVEIVDYMIEHNMNKVNMQLQLHKFIWNPEERGV